MISPVCYSQPYDENIANTTMHYIIVLTYVPAGNMKHTWVFKVPNITKFGFSWQIFIKVMNTKFQRILSSRSHSDKCRQMDIMKLVDASQNYAHTTKNLRIAGMCLWCKGVKYYECVYIFA